jgi:hypothetical protein
MKDFEPLEAKRSAADWSALSEAAEKAGDYLGACDAALSGLEQDPTARELQYRAVLNLSRMGANRRARQLWEHYKLAPHLHDGIADARLEEYIAALGPRLEREEALAAPAGQRAAKLKTAAEHYETVYRATGSTFLGINAATLHELSGGTGRAKEIAANILKLCLALRPGSAAEAYQLAADRAAASLLLDDLDGAQTAIETAAAQSPNAASIASTRKQLLSLCAHKRIGTDIIEPLRNATVIHYTGHLIAPQGAPGRFPAHAEAEVAKEIQAQLDAHHVGYGYGSLACGADTLFVEALLRRHAEVDVILPLETNSFLKQSVSAAGARWQDRFRDCLSRVRLINATEDDYAGGDAVFAYASRMAMGLSVLRARQLSSELLQIAVWDGRRTGSAVGSVANMQAWQSCGHETITIDSRGDLAGAAAPGRVMPERDGPARTMRAIMFGDFHGFSRLTDRQLLSFYQRIVPVIAAVTDRYAGGINVRNTWGDGLFLVFDALGDAARCALDIQAALAAIDLHAHGLPATLSLRVGLDAGAVIEVADPIAKSRTFTGRHISRTARLEPTTPPGEVYATEAFAALFSLLDNPEITCDYVGMMNAAKNYGRLRTYLLRRSA